MNKKNIIYYFSIILLITSILLIVGNNIPVFASFRWLWAPLFLIISLTLFPEVLTHRPVKSVIYYGIFFVLLLPNIIWIYADEWYERMIFEDFYALAVFVILYEIIRNNDYQKEMMKMSYYGLIFFFITGLMTIIATHINLSIVRASYSSGHKDVVNYDSIFKLGFGSYGYMSTICALFPILIYFIKNKTKSKLTQRLALFLLFFFLFVEIRGMIFANIIVSIIFISLAVFGVKNFKKNLIILIIIITTIFIVPNSVFADLTLSVSYLFEPNTFLNSKFRDFSYFLSDPVIFEYSIGGRGEALSRAQRYPQLLDAFMGNPILGDASYKSEFKREMDAGGHLFWMSRLALWGVLGFIGYFFILKNIFSKIIIDFDDSFKFYYLLSLSSIFVLGLLKNLGGREIYIMLLIIIPGLYLTQFGESKN